MKHPICVTLIAICMLTACTVQRQWTATGGSRADGTVKLSYEISEFETANITASQGIPVAASRCRAWGYGGAEPFGGIVRTCQLPGGMSGCARWMMTMEFQCTSGASPMSSVAPPATPPPLYTQPEPVVSSQPVVPPAAPGAPGRTHNPDGTATGFAPQPQELPRNDAKVQQLARTLGCAPPALLAKTASTETFQVACPGGQHRIIQCEFSNCRVMQ